MLRDPARQIDGVHAVDAEEEHMPEAGTIVVVIAAMGAGDAGAESGEKNANEPDVRSLVHIFTSEERRRR